MTAFVRPWWVLNHEPTGVGDGVHAAQAFLEGRGSHGSGGQHVGARFDVPAVRVGPRQVAMDEPHALQGNAIRQRMKSRRAVGFETMHEGVDARGGGDSGRQPHGQFRVGNDHPRHHLRMENDFLLMRLFIEDDAGAADLRARARGGRHRDHGGDAGGVRAGPPVADVLEIPQRASLARHEGHDLAGVQGRSAAEGHHAIVAAAAKGTQSRLDMA